MWPKVNVIGYRSTPFFFHRPPFLRGASEMIDEEKQALLMESGTAKVSSVRVAQSLYHVI
jgi:hypothetical protein